MNIFNAMIAPIPPAGHGIFAVSLNLFQNIGVNNFKKNISSEKLTASLHRYSLKLTKDLDRRKDLFQETYYRLLKNQEKYQDVENLIPISITIMKNIFLDSVGKISEQQINEGIDNEIEIQGSQGNIMFENESNNSSYDELRACMTKLTLEQRDIIHLWQDGVSYKDVSNYLGITVANAKVKFLRAKDFLFKCINELRNR